MSAARPRPVLSLRGEQSLVLEPRLLQAIEVLQLPAQDLEGWLQAAAERNEALRVAGPPLERGRVTAAGWEATERHDEMLRNQPERAPSLEASLEDQVAWLELDEALEEAVRFLLACLDESGYLSASDEDLLELAAGQGLDLDAGLLGRAIAKVQRLEPRGVGGRDLVESLLLQLDPGAADYELLCRLVEEFLDELATNKLPAVAKALGVDLDELRRLTAELRELDPRPGAKLVEAAAPALRADVLVLPAEGGGWQVSLDRGALPTVGLDPELSEVARDRGLDRATREWARERLDRARWVVDAVEQRGATLLRVARRVFEHQRAYLEREDGPLVPLSMGALAEELDLHVSTISRTVAGKHVQTPRGLEPLRRFFQSAAPGAGGEGPAVARDDLREVVRRLFEEEDSSAPLSDEEAVAALAEAGHKVARRTVAKYRKELGIPSSYRRRAY